MYLILAIQKETLHVGCYFSFVHCLCRRGGKTSLKSRREQFLKVTSGKTVRPRAGALPALPALRGRSQSGRPAESLGCAPTARGSSRQSHPEKGGSVMMAARGRRLLPRSLPTPPAARDPPPSLGPRAALPRADADATHRSPQGARAPAPRASPVPGANQTNNAFPAALLPLPADRLASSHLRRSRSERRISAGAERTQATSGATW